MKNCSEKSNYFYNSSPILGSTDNIVWNEEDIECLGVCSGSRLTTLQLAIIEKLCEVVGNTDLSGIIIPDCLKTAFGTKDKTVLEFIQFLLDNDCLIKSDIDNLQDQLDNFNPLITVDYPSCCENACLPGETYTISQHFEKVLGCLCYQASRINELESTIASQATAITSLNTQYNQLNTTLSTVVTNLTNLTIKVNDIEDNCCG